MAGFRGVIEMMLRATLVAGAALAALAAASPAAALTIVQTETIASAAAGTTTAVSFDQFDALLGTLDSVMLSFTAEMPSVSGTLRNNPGTQRTFTLTRGIRTGLSGNGFMLDADLGTGMSTIGPLNANQQVNIGPFSGGSGGDSDTLLAGLGAFVGPGTVSFNFTRQSLFSINPSSGTLTITPSAGGSASLTYNYTAFPPPPPPPPLPGAVPEPATWAMMILGMGAAGAVLRRRRTLAPIRITA